MEIYRKPARCLHFIARLFSVIENIQEISSLSKSKREREWSGLRGGYLNLKKKSI